MITVPNEYSPCSDGDICDFTHFSISPGACGWQLEMYLTTLPGPRHTLAPCETLQLPHWSHANFVSSSLFLLWTFRWWLGQSPLRWKRTPQQTTYPNVYLKRAFSKEPTATSGRQKSVPHYQWQSLSTDWKFWNWISFSPSFWQKSLSCTTFHGYNPLLPLPYCTSSTVYRTKFYMLYR